MAKRRRKKPSGPARPEAARDADPTTADETAEAAEPAQSPPTERVKAGDATLATPISEAEAESMFERLRPDPPTNRPAAASPGKQEKSADNDEETAPFAPLNWALSIGGVALLVLGYILLSQADAQGTNLAARVSPFIILGAYLMVFVAIVLRVPPKDSGSENANGR